MPTTRTNYKPPRAKSTKIERMRVMVWMEDHLKEIQKRGKTSADVVDVLKEKLGVTVCPATVCRYAKELGMPFSKKPFTRRKAASPNRPTPDNGELVAALLLVGEKIERLNSLLEKVDGLGKA